MSLSDCGPVRVTRAPQLPHLQDDTHLGERAEEAPPGLFVGTENPSNTLLYNLMGPMDA